MVVIGDERKYPMVKEAFFDRYQSICGEKALEEVAEMDIYDLMLAAIVGFAGLRPTLKAIRMAKRWRWQTKKHWLWPVTL